MDDDDDNDGIKDNVDRDDDDEDQDDDDHEEITAQIDANRLQNVKFYRIVNKTEEPVPIDSVKYFFRKKQSVLVIKSISIINDKL